MVAISLYKGNLHKVPDVPRRWTIPPPKISAKNFRILLRRRSRALSRLLSSSHYSDSDLHAIESCAFKLLNWRPFTKTLDPDPPARLHDGAHSKRPYLADRATSSFSIDAILDMSKLSLFDDDKVLSLSAARKRWFARKRRRRGGSRSVSGRSSDRRGYYSIVYSVYLTQLERHEKSMLRSKNDKLRAENMSIRDAMRNPMCTNCGGPAVLGEISLEEQHLRIENARLKDELDRVCALAGKFLGRPISSLAPPTPNSSLELGIGTNWFGLNPTLPLVPSDFNVGISSPPKSTMNVIPIEKSYERSMYLELALTEPAPIYLWRPEVRIRAGWPWFLLGTIAQFAVVT